MSTVATTALRADETVAPPHLVTLGGGWALWRSVFLRSAGFPLQRVLDLEAPACADACDRLLETLDAQREAAAAAATALRTLADAAPPPQCFHLRAAAKAILRGRTPDRRGITAEAQQALSEYGRTESATRAAADRFVSGYDEACVAAADRLRAAARDGDFQEAVIWQNRQGFQTAVLPFIEGRACSPSQAARRAALVIWYLQRYCAKNDTIGFFGPVGIARWADDAPALTVRPGGRLLDRRRLFFEVWSIDAIAAALAQAHALSGRFDVPVCAHPDAWLRDRLREIASAETRAACLDAFGQIESSARQVEASAGDPLALDRALDELEGRFTAVTGRPSTQGHGRMYAARAIVYEDTRRDVDVVLGPALLETLAPALGLVLRVTRAFTTAFASAYEDAFDGLYERLAATRPVDGLTFWNAAQPMLFGSAHVAGQVFADFQDAWCELVGCVEGERSVQLASDALEPRLDARFPSTAAAWVGGIHHCPDLMIAAADAAAVCRGDFEAVLGEMHAGMNTLLNACFAGQHPAPGALQQALEHDVPVVRVVPVLPKYSPRESGRTHDAVRRRDDLPLFGERAGGSGDPTLAACRMQKGADGRLLVTHPAGRSFGVLDFFSGYLSKVLARTFNLGLPGAHTPRVTIDRLVVSRETWRVPTHAVPLTDVRGADLFLAARIWKRALGLPRFIYVRPPDELKPFFVDFDSPALVDLLARAFRRAAAARGEPTIITEMLPRPSQLWLTDREGRRYTSELRLAAVDLDARRRVLVAAGAAAEC